MKRTNVLVVLATVSAGVILISNLAATKLIDFFGIAVDGGVVIFPISYIVGDVVVELFGKKQAKVVIWAGFGLNLLAMLTLVIVGWLPPYPGWEGQEAYVAIFGFAPRIVLGSLLAYIVSSLMNNYVFEKIKNKTGEKWLGARTIGSSLVAHVFDSGIFETVAFLGVLPFGEFLAQAGFAYIAGIGLEIILTPLTYLVVNRLKKAIKDERTIEKRRGKNGR